MSYIHLSYLIEKMKIGKYEKLLLNLDETKRKSYTYQNFKTNFRSKPKINKVPKVIKFIQNTLVKIKYLYEYKSYKICEKRF